MDAIVNGALNTNTSCTTSMEGNVGKIKAENRDLGKELVLGETAVLGGK